MVVYPRLFQLPYWMQVDLICEEIVARGDVDIALIDENHKKVLCGVYEYGIPAKNIPDCWQEIPKLVEHAKSLVPEADL